MRRWFGWVFFGMSVCGFALAGCGDDEPAKADFTVEVQTFRFFPNTVSVPVGSTVRWVNVNPRDSVRTVTSGEGPEDAEAGSLFDETLLGYPSGKPEGDSYIYRFEDRGSFPYFSRFPAGNEFTGRIEVQ